MTNLNRLAIIAVLIAIGTVTVEAVKTKILTDPTFDYTKLSTWAWSPAGAGDVKIWMTAAPKPEPVKRQWEPVIMKHVEDQLAAQGYSRATTGTPDFVMTYMVIATVGTSAQQAGQFLPTNANWGLQPFMPQTTSLDMSPAGLLIIDAAAGTPSTVVWRGMAQAKVEAEIAESKRAERLQSAIKDLLSKFPKKGAKKG
jgi:hypothetical protein